MAAHLLPSVVQKKRELAPNTPIAIGEVAKTSTGPVPQSFWISATKKRNLIVK